MAREKTAQSNIQYKEFSFEVKAMDEDSDYHYFEGYLSTYGNVDRVDEVMERGCFDDSLKSHVPMLLWVHKPDEPIGVFIELRSEEKGLWVKGKMPKADTLVSGRVFPQMKVGSVRSMSVGFIKEKWRDEGGIRYHEKSFLVEGSLVPFPANKKARVQNIKSFTIEDVEEIKTKRDYEKLLRESGAFSNKAVVYLASKFKEDEEPQGEPEVLKDFLSKFKTLTTQIKGN